MAIYRLTVTRSFGPDEIDAMTAAYEGALIDLRLDRDDPLTELGAKSIVNVTTTRERRPTKIKERTECARGRQAGRCHPLQPFPIAGETERRQGKERSAVAAFELGWVCAT
jgi:hypothetical protein